MRIGPEPCTDYSFKRTDANVCFPRLRVSPTQSMFPLAEPIWVMQFEKKNDLFI